MNWLTPTDERMQPPLTRLQRLWLDVYSAVYSASTKVRCRARYWSNRAGWERLHK